MDRKLIVCIGAICLIAGIILIIIFECRSRRSRRRDQKWMDFIRKVCIPYLTANIGIEITKAVEREMSLIPEKLKDIRKEMEEI